MTRTVRATSRSSRRNAWRGSGSTWQVAFARPTVQAVKLNRSPKLPLARSYAQAAKIAKINRGEV